MEAVRIPDIKIGMARANLNFSTSPIYSYQKRLCFFQRRVDFSKSCQCPLQDRKDSINNKCYCWQGSDSHKRNEKTKQSKGWNSLEDTCYLQTPLGQTFLLDRISPKGTAIAIAIIKARRRCEGVQKSNSHSSLRSIKVSNRFITYLLEL